MYISLHCAGLYTNTYVPLPLGAPTSGRQGQCPVLPLVIKARRKVSRVYTKNSMISLDEKMVPCAIYESSSVRAEDQSGSFSTNVYLRIYKAKQPWRPLYGFV